VHAANISPISFGGAAISEETEGCRGDAAKQAARSTLLFRWTTVCVDTVHKFLAHVAVYDDGLYFGHYLPLSARVMYDEVYTCSSVLD
jgi:hypothetical protein